MAASDPTGGLLDALVAADVEFIVVGGMAAVLQGAPIVTNDLDICHSRAPENVEKLIALLRELDARYRGQPTGRILRPAEVELAGDGHLNLTTALGPLDVLCELERGEGYEQLRSDVVEKSDGAVVVSVLGLERLVEIKGRSNRAKDRLMLPELLAALARKEDPATER